MRFQSFQMANLCNKTQDIVHLYASKRMCNLLLLGGMFKLVSRSFQGFYIFIVSMYVNVSVSNFISKYNCSFACVCIYQFLLHGFSNSVVKCYQI